MATVEDKHFGIQTMKGTVFEILQGHVQGLDGNDYYQGASGDNGGEIDGELVSKSLAKKLIDKGILREKKKTEKKKTEKKKEK